MAAIALGAGPYPGRALSIGVAAGVTWRLNRRYTFAPGNLSERHEGIRYFIGVALGSSLNYALYAGLIAAGIHPVAALVVASGVVMGFSYLFYRFVVFGGGDAARTSTRPRHAAPFGSR